MSMNGSFRRISGGLYERLRRDPTPMPRVRGASEDRMTEAQIAQMVARAPERIRDRLIAQMRERNAELDAMPAVDPADLGPILEIDKAWHVVHFAVAGTVWDTRPTDPATWLVLGGDECGGDAGYGPARLHGPAAVAAIANALPSIEAMRARLDPAAFAAATELYPPGVSGEPIDGTWKWVADVYAEVRAFYAEAAGAGDAIVIWLS
jgi:hypothetical protein